MDTNSILEFIGRDNAIYFATSDFMDTNKIFLCQETEFTPKMIMGHSTAVALLREILPGVSFVDSRQESPEQSVKRLSAKKFPPVAF